MRRALKLMPAGQWDRTREAGSVTLGWDDRHRRRIALKTDQGIEFLLDLAEAARLAEGDGLALEGGGILRIVAAPEPVLQIRSGNSSLARLAYHLGNRHLPVQLEEDMLIIRTDPVIAEMVRGLGGECQTAYRPFTPEAGAYDTAGGSHHAADAQEHAAPGYESHGHAHGGDHDHSHDHGHAHPHRHS